MAHTYSTGNESEELIWNVERLWELSRDLPVEIVPLSDVVAALDQSCWFADEKPSPRDVARHAKQIDAADFTYPIILSSRGDVMDGVHRIARAWILGMKEIRAVRFPEDPEPDERRPRAAREDEGKALGRPLPARGTLDQVCAAVQSLSPAGDNIVGHFGVFSGKTWWSIRSGGAVDKLLANPDHEVAQALSALGNGTRLAILRSLLRGPKSAAELVAELHLGTIGQPDHHLCELEKAGYIEQRGGRYQFAEERKRVYLTALGLAADSGAESPDEEKGA